ncbi:hypothetical protein [Bradyrhizobium sp. LTSPM299]|uniref:hypothetical protein n=1 Tax=Bradyrhizobium sp. LTSPM299 TaxID=1619233 RepID=UPI000ABEC3AE|nr:hypothetical protein [Bradyrhizobium sp. LTSPM299]
MPTILAVHVKLGTLRFAHPTDSQNKSRRLRISDGGFFNVSKRQNGWMDSVPNTMAAITAKALYSATV